MVYVLPLFLLAISYSIVSVDLENGTLALILAQGTSLRTLLVARLGVRFGVAMCCVFLSCVGAFLAAPAHALTGPVPVYLLLLLTAIAVYTLFWLVVSLLVQVLVRRSAAGAVIQLAIWVFLVLVAPALINVYASSLHPAPSRIAQIQELRRAANIANGRGAQTLQKFLNDHPDLAPKSASAGMSDFFSSTFAVRTETQSAVQPVLDRFTLERQRREGILRRLRFLSPAIVMRLTMEDVAGSGDSRYAQFVRQFDGFHQQWREFFSRRILQQMKFSPADYDAVPAFTLKEEESGAFCLHTLLSLSGIAVPVFVLIVLTAKYLARFKPIS